MGKKLPRASPGGGNQPGAGLLGDNQQLWAYREISGV